MSYFVISKSDADIIHFGVKHRSGRYPWGSGERPFQGEKHAKFMGKSRDQDIRFKKGKKVYRVTRTNKLSNSPKDATYVALLKSDHYKYAEYAVLQNSKIASYTFKGDNENEGRPYMMTLQLKNDVIAPSYQKTFEAFVDTIRDVGLKQVANDVASTRKKLKISPLREDFIELAKKMSLQKARESAYFLFASSFMYDTKSRRKFIDILKKQGYNAVIDENDVGFGKRGMKFKSAVILFDQNDLKQKRTKALSKNDVEWLRECYFTRRHNAEIRKNIRNTIKNRKDDRLNSKYKKELNILHKQYNKLNNAQKKYVDKILSEHRDVIGTFDFLSVLQKTIGESKRNV